jgi:hypothetical protein
MAGAAMLWILSPRSQGAKKKSIILNFFAPLRRIPMRVVCHATGAIHPADVEDEDE